VLLFFLPFAEIKCNGSTFAKNSGFGIAIGSKWKSFSDNSMFGKSKEEKNDTEMKKQDPNIYAIVGLGLGLLGLLLSFSNMRSAAGAAMISGVLSSAALIGLMLDLQKKVKTDMGGSASKSGDNNLFGLDKLNDVKMSVEFTPWFWVAVIAFLAAAFFSYKRRTTSTIQSGSGMA
jgi:hypothetical protein